MTQLPEGWRRLVMAASSLAAAWFLARAALGQHDYYNCGDLPGCVAFAIEARWDLFYAAALPAGFYTLAHLARWVLDGFRR